MSTAPRLIQIGTIVKVDEAHGRRYRGDIDLFPIEPFVRTKSKKINYGLSERSFAVAYDLLEILELKTEKEDYPKQPISDRIMVRVKFVVEELILLRRCSAPTMYVVGVPEQFWVRYRDIKLNCSFER